MTQETTKQESANDVTNAAPAGPTNEPATQELDVKQAEGVGGGTDVCDITGISGQIIDTYENLVDATSHIIERVSNAL